jgi:8-amino-3,8-dideoxy-alpha-D-manno-octulosonate transaminase
VSSTQATSKLAIDGGSPAVRQPLPPMYPGGMRIGQEEEDAVLEVIRSKRLFRYYGPSEGPSKVEELEKAFAALMGTTYALAVTSGTGALICSLTGIGIGPGDEVIVPAYTWIASASAVFAVGGVPIPAEVDESLTLDAADVERKITRHTRAIMPVHMRGGPSNMDTLMAVAKKHNLKVVEDTAQADGASFHGKRLGSIGDVGAFSLQFNKIITSGEGGIVITNDKEVWKRAVMFHDVIGGARNNIPEEEVLPGMNFRMTELQAAVAGAQLKKLDGLLDQMRQRKTMLKTSMNDVAGRKGVTFRKENDPAGDAAICLVFFLPEAERAHKVAQALTAEGAGANVMYTPGASDYHIYPYWSPIMNKRTWTPTGGPWRWHEGEVNYTPDMCPRTLELLSRAVHMDVSPDLTNDQVEEVAEALNKVLDALA